MSSIKVVNVNEEAKQEAVEEPEQIEEATEQIEPTIEVVDNPPVEDVKEEAVEKPKPKAKPKPTDRVDCKTCGKNLSYKNYRYRHEKICSEEPKPVKPQANPKGKSKPKVQPIIKEVEVEEEQSITQLKLTQPVSNQVLKPRSAGVVQGTNPPSNPLADITNHYQLLQQQFIQQKKEKYNNLCQSMFSSKSKKR